MKHLTSIHKRNVYKCNKCDLTFKSKAHLINHTKTTQQKILNSTFHLYYFIFNLYMCLIYVAYVDLPIFFLCIFNVPKQNTPPTKPNKLSKSKVFPTVLSYLHHISLKVSFLLSLLFLFNCKSVTYFQCVTMPQWRGEIYNMKINNI